MVDDIALFSSPELKDIIKDMRDFLSQSRVAFLIGAGCSKIAGLPLMSELTSEIMEDKKLSPETKELIEQIRDLFTGANSSTIEDYMSEIVDLLSITERRSRRGAEHRKISIGDQERSFEELQNALDEIKLAISNSIASKNMDITIHQQFIRAIHSSLQAGKGLRSVDYFVLNYDTLVEDALGLEKIPYYDGFTGAVTGWWESDAFDTHNGARVFKIHGSIDWCLLEGDTQPRRIRPGIKPEATKKQILIYPAATKYQETQRDPFAQMLSFMRKGLCPKDDNETIMAICGYSFGDLHIDSEIEDALRQSKGYFQIAVFTSDDEPKGKLKDWLKKPDISNQIRVYANNSYRHGDEIIKFSDDIPWWKFEVLTKLLRGER